GPEGRVPGPRGDAGPAWSGACRRRRGERMRSAIRVVIADDQAMVVEGFAALLDAQPDIQVVGKADNGREAVDATRRLAPDVVLMDVRMPVMDGLTATRRLFGDAGGNAADHGPR